MHGQQTVNFFSIPKVLVNKDGMVELGAYEAKGFQAHLLQPVKQLQETPDTYVGDLSCVMAEELSMKDFTSLLSANSNPTCILDSGTSSYLLKDRDVFWTYEVTSARPMKAANHGILQTKASGNCLVRLTLRGVTTTVKLWDCLHAPDACVNHLSVGRMTAAGSKIGCSMDNGKFAIVRKNPDRSCENVYKGEQSNNLYFVKVEFVYPPKKCPVESALFSRVVEMMDLWHHRMGHIREAAT